MLFRSAKFLQNVTVEADGDIITEEILHCKVASGSSIYVENGKGLIVGGSVLAKDLIAAKTIGSPMGTVSVVQIGMAPGIHREFQKLGEEMQAKFQSIEKIDKSIGFLKEKAQQRQLDSQKQEMFKQLIASRTPLVDEYEEIRAKYEKMGEKVRNIQDGIIKASDAVYPGVRVEFGTMVKYIDDKVIRCTIRKLDGDINVS